MERKGYLDRHRREEEFSCACAASAGAWRTVAPVQKGRVAAAFERRALLGTSKIKAHQTHTTRARSLRPMIHIRVAQLVRRDAKGRADEPRPTNLV